MIPASAYKNKTCGEDDSDRVLNHSSDMAESGIMGFHASAVARIGSYLCSPRGTNRAREPIER